MVANPCLLHLSQLICDGLEPLAKDAPNLDPKEVARWFDKPPKEDMGDYALPCFRLAKPLKMKPNDIALALKDHLGALDDRWLASADTAGAFLNVRFKPKAMAEWLNDELGQGRYFARSNDAERPKVMIEYSQPNTHKEFHIGHVRNVALGDGLYRMYRYCGYPVIPVNYIGDEGAHTAKCIWFMRKENMTPPSQDRGVWLGEVYSKAVRYLADHPDNPDDQAEISKVLAELEAKQGAYYKLWQETRDWSLQAFDQVYTWLDAHFDHVFFESEMTDEAQQTVDRFLDQGVFENSDGAVGMDLKQEKLGYLVLRKKDGATLYATKDLALARRKFDDFHIDHSIYVVASEQAHHFRQVFRTLEKMGFSQAKDCYHLSYGMVVLPEGKMSSRDGTAIPFWRLVKSMEQKLAPFLEKYQGDWSDDEIAKTNEKICRAAIKYGMLRSDPTKDIVFDMDEWLSFEGDSGPYLVYAYSRSQSILRKASSLALNWTEPDFSHLSHSDEAVLLRYAIEFNDVVEKSCHHHRPSTLSQHLYDMCRAFSRFYTNVPILKDPSHPATSARLAVVSLFAQVLHQGLYLLGIDPPDRM